MFGDIDDEKMLAISMPNWTGFKRRMHYSYVVCEKRDAH